ncbi:MAG: hypothetical protein ACXWJM_12850 [Ramlibacter sp.]
MKIPALITALALAGGVAVAQANTAATHDASTNSQTTAAAPDDSQHEGLGTKLKKGLHRMGQATRNAMHRMAGAGKKDKTTDTAAANDTRSMGSYGTSPDDSARQKRMDDAYDNYKAKPKQ